MMIPLLPSPQPLPQERGKLAWAHCRLPKKRCRKLPAGGLGVSPSLNIPQEWGIEGVDEDFFSSSVGGYGFLARLQRTRNDSHITER